MAVGSDPMNSPAMVGCGTWMSAGNSITHSLGLVVGDCRERSGEMASVG